MPIFKTFTHLPPYVGMMLSLAVISAVAEYLSNNEFSIAGATSGHGVNDPQHSPVHKSLSKIEMPSILFFLGIFYLIWIAIFFQESHINKNLNALKVKTIFSNYLLLLQQLNFLRYAVVSGFSYGVLFSYISLSAYFIIEVMHFNLISFGVMVACNALPIIITAMLARRIAKTISIKFIVFGLIGPLSKSLGLWSESCPYNHQATFFPHEMYLYIYILNYTFDLLNLG